MMAKILNLLYFLSFLDLENFIDAAVLPDLEAGFQLKSYT